MAALPIQPVTFSEAVLLRPEMYTPGGTFVEAIAFLEGYYSGMAKTNPYAAPVVEWEDFRRWLANQLSVDTSEVLGRFVACYGQDQAARKNLLDRLSDFYKSREKIEG
jgi:hypothetical protein